MYGHFLVLAVVSIVLPFILITVGEGSIDSALAAILNSTVPLGVIVLAPMFLPDERVTVARIAGLALGFCGVILLVAPDLANLSQANLAGELMMIGSSLCYACGNVYARRNVHGLSPMIPAVFQVAIAALIVVPLALLVDRPFTDVTPAPEAIVAVLWLGILGSGIAYLCYFTILRAWGATRTSTVSYLLPVVGIAAGAIVLGDPVTPGRIVGTALIIGGIALVSSGPGFRRLLDRRLNAAAAQGR
jgi:drug/metabolite transporter (DMT)-like permease